MEKNQTQTQQPQKTKSKKPKINNIMNLIRAIMFIPLFFVYLVWIIVDYLFLSKLYGKFPFSLLRIHKLNPQPHVTITRFVFWLALKFFRIRLHCVQDDKVIQFFDKFVNWQKKAQFEQLEDPFILMFKHGSNIDCAGIIITIYPHWMHYVAKDSLFKIPVFGKALYRAAVPIQRENLSQAIETLNSCVTEIVEKKKAVAIAPEGLRRRHDSFTEPKILPFKKGPFHLAKQGNVAILPVILYGGHRIWPQGQLIPNNGTVIIRYMSLIPKETVQQSSIEELQQLVKQKYEEGLKWEVPDSYFKVNPEIAQCNLIIFGSLVVFYTFVAVVAWVGWKVVRIIAF